MANLFLKQMRQLEKGHPNVLFELKGFVNGTSFNFYRMSKKSIFIYID